ncbi:MAG: glycine cleavage system protein GcvH [Alphaproteobacteria bacterium]|nr:glycine cleavage system protein GcvH [Alphaproteobacteria bacterium]
MSGLRYTKDHEWARLDGEVATVGITDYAQAQLGDIVFVELPEPGKAMGQGEEAAVVESVKAASEVYAPLGGEVVEVNASLQDEPALVNADPMGRGWFLKLKLSDPAAFDSLMDEASYQAYLKELA